MLREDIMFRYHTATDGRAYGTDASGRLVRLQKPRERGVVSAGADGVAVGRDTLPELLDALGVSRSVMFCDGVKCDGDTAMSDDEWAAARAAS